MSIDSKLALSLIKAGYEPPNKEWMGDLERTWKYHVEDSCSKKGTCIVYLIQLNIENLNYIKVGITTDIKQRLKAHKYLFPFGICTLLKTTLVKNKNVAKKCETNFLIACRNFVINYSEWIDLNKIGVQNA